jgi:uncharacterized repeat protein (TIGR01451 family)
MISSTQDSTPASSTQLPSHSPSDQAAVPGRRRRGGPFAWTALLASLLFLLFGAPVVQAHQQPPGCTGSGLGILLFTDSPDVHIGDTLNYSITVFNGTGVGPVVCDADFIQAFVITPDGVSHPITLVRTSMSNGQSDYYTNVVSYLVRAQDVQPDGTVRATASDTGRIHQNDTDSQGGGNQGVNTQVSLPCIGLTVQCAGGVGETGAITFTGTVTNCGNNTLVGVTVTNFVNGGVFQVTFITNLLQGQIASFSGSWIPSNPCSPSTATLVAQGIDQFTTHPRTVTSSATATCSDVLTPGLKVTKACPASPVAPGQLLTFSGSVSNTGNVTLTNIVVVDNQPAANTRVFSAASLAPHAVTNFTGSYAAPTNCSVADTLTATASSSCGVLVSDTASVTCPILTTPLIAVTAICPVSPILPGGPLNYSGLVRNTGNITLTNVVVVSDRPSANTPVLSVPALAPGASASFTTAYTVPSSGCSVTTTFSATGRDVCTLNAVTNNVTTTCPVTTAPAIAVTLACPAVSAASGGPITYSGTVSNSGNVTLTNVSVTDLQASPSTVLAVATLAPQASANFTATFTAPTNSCSVSSTVTARGSDGCSAIVVSSTASATCSLTVNPRLVVTQNCSETPVSPGGLLTYSGSVSNAGNIALTNIAVVNNRSGATTVFASPLLLPGAITNFTGSYVVPAGTVCSITAIVTATGRDTCSGNVVSATNSATCPITGSPRIAVTLNCPVVPVATGGLITYSGTVSNSGNVTLNSVVVVDNQASPSTVLSLASLAPGVSSNFTARFTAPANACTVSSSVTARGSDTCSATSVTNSASATCALVTTPRIVVIQDCPTNPASAGGVLTYSGSVSNAGDITLTNIVVINNQRSVNTNSSGTNAAASFGTISPPLVPPAGTVTPRFVVGSNFNGLVFAPQDEGYAADQFYSMRREVSGSSTFVTINASGTVTGRFDAGNRNFDALTFAAPDVGYGPVIFYYLRHDSAGVSTFGTITPGGAVGVVADLFVVGNNFDALTFSGTDVGYGANMFYYLRHDNTGHSFFGTINPALPGTITDRFPVGTNFDALAFTATDVGYGANLFYYLRHGSDGRSTFGTISATGTVTDRFGVGTNLSELAFATTDVGFAANLFYYLGAGANSGGANTNQQPVFVAGSLAPGASTNFTGSYTVDGTNACSVTAIVTVTATDICSGNTITNTTTTTCPLTTAPRILVSLNCPEGSAPAGGLITFSGTVSNPGNVALNNVTVVDAQASPSTVLTVATLPVGASANFTASFTAPSNTCSVSSTVTARGSDACTTSMVTNVASATCSLLTTPRLVVTENCSGTPVGPGGLMTYSGSVSNAGNITLTNVLVLNDRTGTTPVFTAATFAPHASANFTGNYPVPAGACSVTAVLTATGKDCSGTTATNTASATCPITGTPRIMVTQNCPATPSAPGGVIIYTGTVSNSGNVTLTNVVVVNNRSGSNVIFSVALLAPGGTANFTGRYNVPVNCCTVSSTVLATGGTPCSGVTVSDTATATCTVLTSPQIVVTKVCPTGAPGDVLHYSGTVSNAGNITLIDVTVVNNQPHTNSPVLGPITLAPGESVNYLGSYTPSPDSCGTDTVTARGLDACTQAAVVSSVTTTCPFGASSPGIGVTKNCPLTPTPRGGIYTFTGMVTNTGNVTLINVYVVDDEPTNNTPIIGPITLAPGGSVSFTNSYTAPSCCCLILDTLTARGQDRCSGSNVVATATAECPLLSTPAIVVVEHCPAASVPVGGLYEFTGSVTNTGDVVLRNVYVVSSQPAANTPLLGPIELAPGESEDFSGSFTVVAGSAGLTVSASGVDTCQGRSVAAAANCSGPITPPNQPRAITVVVNGSGTVSGVANGQLLNLGQNYTATATPAEGSSFVNWSGGVSGTSTSLTFMMKSNLVVIATFNSTSTNGTNAFTPVAGVFNGLFFDTNDIESASSGSFTLTMKATGAYNALVQNQGRKYSVKGALDSNGQAANTILRAGKSALTVNWQGNLSDSDYLGGTVSDGAFVAELEGGRNVFSAANAAPQAGKYTLIIQGIVDAIDSPAGNSYATAVVGVNGIVHLQAQLADNTVGLQTVGISKNGEWPVCLPLYGGKGILIGWLQFVDDGSNDLSGTLRWIKPAIPTSKLYKPGFAVNTDVIGSHYRAPIGTSSVLQITDGMFSFTGGNLPDSANPVTFGPSSKLVNHGPNTLTVTFTTASGLFKGTFKEAGTASLFPIKGAVLQRQNNGSGYAPGASQSGRANFEATP